MTQIAYLEVGSKAAEMASIPREQVPLIGEELHLTYRGLITIVMNKYELQGFLKAMESFRSTNAMLVPSIILQLAKSATVDASDISSLKCSCAVRRLFLENY